MLVDLVAAAALIRRPVIRPDTLKEILLPDDLRKEIGSVIGGEVGQYSTSITATRIDKDSRQKFVTIFPNQYFRIAVELFDFAPEVMKYADYLDPIRGLPYFKADNKADKASILNELSSVRGVSAVTLSPSDADLFAAFLAEKDSTARLKAKSLFNRAKNTNKLILRRSNDCFGSVILKVINTQNASAEVLGDIVYALTKNPLVYQQLKDFYENQVAASSLEPSMDQSLDQSIDQSDWLELPKPFLLLAGISGTGKTRFVAKQAEAQGLEADCYELVSVRPDWHEPSDLLGYVSRVSGEKFITTPFLKFMGKAWRAAISSATIDGFKLKVLDQIPTFWACLDEMNLAPVEQYFADFLAILETRKWESGEYSCLPIFSPKHLMLTKVEALDEVARDLGFDPSDGMWSYITEHGMPLPPNLIVAGTVNMDETAHGFSRKVIDRAITIDFGEFYPNNFDDYFDPIASNKIFKFPRGSSIEKSELSSIVPDPDGTRTIAFLEKINGEGLLKNTPFELAYRALNELLLSVKCFDPQSDIELFSIWDDFLMTKLLPRIEGDSDKLISRREGSAHDMDQNTLLTDLLEELKAQFKVAENMLRPDLFRTDIANSAMPIEIEFRTIKKLAWMQRRLSRDRFTSFWP